MAIESPTPSTSPQVGSEAVAASDVAPAIENEFPTYRAISPLAIASLVLGILSVLSFADSMFLLVALAAVVVGVYADWKIKQVPEVLTGRKLASAGVALGLIFGLGSFTVDRVDTTIRRTEAQKFARMYIDALKTRSMSECLWYRMRPAGRANMKPEDAVPMLQESARDSGMFETQTQPIRLIKERISKPGQTITLHGLEGDGMDGLNPYAQVLLRLAGPATKEFPDTEQFALLVLKGEKGKNGIAWWIDDFQFPYKLNTHVMQEKPIDDGHGHTGH